MLRIEDLSKTFPGRVTPAVDGLNLELRDGEVLGLVGLNGAGKTTTIRAAAGVSLPSKGRILVDGHDVVRDKVRASERIGWVPELFPFEPNAKAARLLTFYAGFHGVTGEAARHRAYELLERVGLKGVEDVRVRTYSQGMKKRFGLAAAMLAEPQHLLLDELLNGLDPEGMAFVRSWILDLRRQGKGVLLSSHQLAELQALADRVAFIHRGRLLKTVGRAELAQASDTTLHVVIENLDAAAIEYLGTLGSVHVDGSTVRLAHPSADAATINVELARRGYRVSELRGEGSSLEAYFLRLIQDPSTVGGVGQ